MISVSSFFFGTSNLYALILGINIELIDTIYSMNSPNSSICCCHHNHAPI